jgi:5'-nucleotidase
VKFSSVKREVAVTGTPTDSVMMALRTVMPDAPDLILSGVNRGANLADDMTYSGTVSAAIEGALAGIRSIAFSQVYAREGMGDDVPFGAAREWGAKVLEKLIDAPMADRTLINVNFPALPPEDVKGIRVVRQGFHDYSRGTIVEGRDPRGYRYFWFGLDQIEHTLDHGTDLEAIEDGYVAASDSRRDGHAAAF